MLPTNFEDKTAFFKAYSKTLNRIIPSTGQSPVAPGGVTIFQLPQASVVSLKSFRLNFHAKTNGTATEIVQFPKFMGSMISRLEIFCNGQSICNISQYGVILGILRDYSRDYQNYVKPCNNSDPSKDTVLSDAGVVTVHDTTGFVNGNTLVNTCEKDYCIDDWIGFLETAPEFFNTNLVGNMEIHITWANADVLGGTVGAVSPTYTITNLVGWIDVLHFKDDAYINELDRKMTVNGEIAIPYKNYRSYLGATTSCNKTSTTRITESTQSLDKIMLTFLPATRTTFAALNTEINNTNFYKRSGLGLGYNSTRTATGTVQFEINSQDVSNPLGMVEVFQETMKCFELDRENHKHMNPLIKDISVYENSFYVAALSTSHLNGANEDKTIISGIDTQATSLNISVKTVQGKATNSAQSAQPLIITEMTAIMRIGGGRQVSVLF